MDNIKEILTLATETGEIINIQYHGGTQPGLQRQILPISIKADNVRAMCLVTNKVKMFKISKMKVIDSSELIKAYDPNKIIVEPKSIVEGLKNHEKSILNLGWVLIIDAKENRAELFHKFKNGKLKKTPSAYIEFREFSEQHSDWDWGADKKASEEIITKLSTRPWYVRSNTTNKYSSFAKLSSAIEKFLTFSKDDAKKLAIKKIL